MRKLFLLLLPFLPLASHSQTVITVQPQQCVWRTGDDPSWAAPNLDETGWQPNPNWRGLSPAAHIWVRCHADLSSLQNEKQPAIQITLYGAYQLFLNGELLGSAGNIRSGVFSMNAIRQYPLQASSLSKLPETIALRITYRVNGVSPVTAAQNMDPPVFHAGNLQTLTARRAQIVVTDSSNLLAPAFATSLIGALGLALFGLFYYDRSRFDLLYLGLQCLILAILRVDSFCVAYQMNLSSTLNFAARSAGNSLGIFAYVLFFFALARRRVPLFYWLPLAIVAVRYAINFITMLLPAEQALWLFRPVNHVGQTTNIVDIAAIITASAPFVAFWPYNRIVGRMRTVAALCLLMGTATLASFIVSISIQRGLLNLLSSWRFEVLEIRNVVTAWVLLALLVLLFRDQRQVTEERALLAGELHAASEIQRMLVPAKLEAAPGLQINVAFHPMSEVGGDFYLCRVLPEGRQRILVGDVSGKGSAAAMTAALLLGGAADQDSLCPANLLVHLNRVLLDSRVGGFATCLCADFAADGSVTLANAGHLPPYLRGDELAIPSGLPLGLNPRNGAFEPFEFTLAPSDTLTFFSDGVIEARSPSGELFGFDRARALSVHTADHIAHAAQAFGQEDDITVLSLTFAPAEVVHV